MSQAITLADLPISPQELDERERQYERDGEWVAWVRFTREMTQNLEERTRFAMWARLAKKFEKIAYDLDERQASLSSDLCVLSAKIWQQELSRPEMAVKLFTKGYHFDPDNLETLKGARLIYEARGEWELALQLTTFEQELLKDNHERATLFLHMAEICSKYLGRSDDAVRCVKEATKLIPGFHPAVHYEQLISDVEDQQREQFEQYLEEAKKSKTPRQRARCYHQAAEVMIGIDPQSEEIESLLRQSLEIDARNEKARISLQTFYQLNERWEALAAFLIERLDSTQRRNDRLNILKELAKLSEKALNNLDESVKWHREVLTLDPIDDASINFCTEYYHRHQSWNELVQVYESALKMRRRGQDEGEMLFQIAMILWKKISDYVEAEKYFKRIKLNDPRQPLMLKFYVDFYTLQEDWRRLLTVLSTQQTEAEEVEEKILIGFQMAEVAENQLQSSDKAIEMWRAILRLDPVRPEAIEALTRLYETGNKWSALLELLKDQYELLNEEELTAKIERLEQMIEVYRTRMRQPVMVMNTYRQILELNDRYLPALEALESLYRESSRWTELAEMIERQAEMIKEGDDQESLRTRYYDLAQLNEHQLGNLDQAIHYYEEMLSLSVDLDAIDPLVRLYMGMKDWTSLFETYKQQLTLDSETDERIELLITAARVADEQLSFYQESITLWREVMDLNPEHDEVWEALSDLYQKVQEWEALSELYESKVDQLNQAESSVGNLAEATPVDDQQRIDESSEFVEDNEDEDEIEDEDKEQDDSSKSLLNSAAQAKSSLDVATALPWLKKRADLLSEQMGDDEASANVWWRVLSAEPSDLQAESFLRNFYTERQDLSSIEKLYRIKGELESFMSYINNQLDVSHDDDLICEALIRRGMVALNDLADPETAIESWERALDTRPNDTVAASALLPLYREAGDWSKLSLALSVNYQSFWSRLQADSSQDSAQDDVLLDYQETARELVETYEKLDQHSDAFNICLQRLSLSPEDASLLDESSDFAKRSDPRLEHVLVDFLEALPRESLSPEGEAAILWRTAELLTDPLEEFERATEVYLNYREKAPTIDFANQSLKPLARLYEEREMWDELLEVLDELLLLSDSQDETERLLSQIGIIHEQFTHHLDRAESRYLELLDLNQTSLSAIRGLQRIASARGDQLSLSEYLDLELALCKSSKDFANLKFRLGEIALDREGESVALGHFSAALSHDPSHEESANALSSFLDSELEIAYPSAVLLEPIIRERGDSSLLVKILGKILDGTEAELSLEQIAESSAEVDNEQSIEQELESREYPQDEESEALERDENNEVSELNDDSEVVDQELDTQELETKQELRDAFAILSEIALLQEIDLNDQSSAFETNMRRLQVQAHNLDVLEDVKRLAKETNQWAELANVLNDFSYEGLRDTEESVRYSLSRVLAEVAELELNDQSYAREVWMRVLDAEGDSVDTLDQVARLSEELADWEQLFTALERSLKLVDEPSDKMSRLKRIAVLSRDQLNRVDEAIESYQNVLKIDPRDSESASLLEQLLRDDQRYQELSEHYQSQIELALTDLESFGNRDDVQPTEERGNEALQSESSLSEEALTDTHAEKLIQLRYQLATLFNGHLRNPMEALEQLAFNLNPSEAKVHEPSIVLLEHMLLTYCDGSSESLEVRELGCALLDEVYESRGDWLARIKLVEKKIEDSDVPSDICAHYRQIAVFYERDGAHQREAYDALKVGITHGYFWHDLVSELERLTAELNVWAETCAFLQQALIEQLEVDETERNTMTHRVAGLFEDYLNDPHSAIAVFEFGRKESPEELSILRELNRLYEQTSQPVELAEVLELRIELEASEELEEPMSSASDAELEADMDAELEANMDAELEADMDAELEANMDAELEADMDAELEADMDAELEAELMVSTEQPSLRCTLSYQLGNLYRSELNQPQKAIEIYRRVRTDFNPGDETSYQALVQLFNQEDDMDGLVDLYREQSEYISDLSTREQLLTQAASVSLERLGRSEDAIAFYQDIIEFNPQSESTLVALSKVYSDLGRYEDQLETLQARAEITHESESSALFILERALIYRDQLADPISAIETLQALLLEHPETEGLVAAFESLLATIEVRLEAAKALAPIYRANEQWSQYTAVLHDTLEDRLDMNERVEVYRDLCHVRRDKLDDLSGAFDALRSAYSLNPDLVELEPELEELSALVGRDQDLIETYQHAIMEASDREISLRIKIGAVAENRLGDAELAISSYQDILLQEPDHLGAIEALERLLRSNARYQELAELYNQKLDVIDSTEGREEIFELLASLYEQELSMPLESIEVWRRQLEEDERHLKAFKELERLLTEASSYDELAALYEEWIASCERPSDALEIKARLANLTLSTLQDGVNGIELIREILDQNPAHETSIVMLTKLFAQEERCFEIGADRNLMAELLEPIARGLSVDLPIDTEKATNEIELDDDSHLEESELDEKSAPSVITHHIEANLELLVKVLNVLQINEMDPELRASQLLELASLREEVLNDQGAAFEARLLALRFNPTNLDNRHALQRLSLSTQRHQELADGLEIAANEALDVEDKSSLLLELGKVYESYLDNYERASYFYQEILNDEPNHTGSIQALETLYARLSMFQPLVELYLRLSEESEGDDQRIRRLFQACEMMRHLDAHDLLIETYRSVLEIDDQNVTAYRELERLFHITEEWGALASLLQERIEHFENTDDDVDDDVEVNAEGETETRISVSSTPVASTARTDSRATLRERLAKLLEQLQEFDEAIETWKALLTEDDESYEPAFEALEQLANTWRSMGVDEPRRQTIAEILVPLYSAQGQWEPWVKSNEDLLDFVFDPEERAERYVSIAQVVEIELNDQVRALEYNALAFQSFVEQSGVESELDRLIEETESWSRGINIFETVVAEIFEPEEASRLWLKISALYQDKLNDDERCLSGLLKARELAPDDINVIGKLRAFYTQRQRHRELVALLKEVALLFEEESDRIDALNEAGQLLTQSLNAPQEAIDVYRQLRDERSDDLSPLQELEGLYRQVGDWNAVIEVIREQIELIEGDQNKVSRLHDIAEIFGLQLMETEEQIATLRQALEIIPTESRALNGLKALFNSRQDWTELSHLFEEERTHYEDDSLEAVTLDLELAQLHLEHTQRPFDATEIFGTVLARRTAVELDLDRPELHRAVTGLTLLLDHPETSAEASELLINYFTEVEQFDALRAVIESLISKSQDPIERSELSVKLGELLRDQLSLPKEAFFSFANALRDDVTSDESLTALQVIGGEQGMYTELVEVYKSLAEIDPYSELSGELSRLRAKLCENRLQDLAQATEAWELSLSVDPEHPETLKALAGLYDQQERWSDLIKILETRVDLEPDEFELRVLLGELIVRVFGDAHRAIDQWKMVLMDFPHAESAQRMLENYISSAEFVDEISLVLEPLYQEREQWDSLIKLNMALLNESPMLDTARREELWAEMGKLYAEHLGDYSAAIEAYTQAFLINPMEQETRAKLFPLVEDAALWRDFAPKLALVTDQISDPELLVEDNLRLASWGETHLDDQEMAIKAYRSALRADPETSVAIDALTRIYTARSEWSSLAEMQQIKLDATYDEQARGILLKERGENLWRNLGLLNEAQAHFEELVNLDDKVTSSYQLLESLLNERGDQQAVLDLLERKLEALGLSGEEAVRLQKRMIHIAQEMGDQYRAIDIARSAYEDHPSDRELYSTLAGLFEAQGSFDDLRDLKEGLLENLSGRERNSVLRELAVLCERQGLADDAVDHWTAILKEIPSDAEAFEAAHRLLKETMRFEDLIEVIDHYLKASDQLSSEQRVKLALELAQRAQEEGMQERAVSALEEVLSGDPHHPLALSGLAQAYEEDGDWDKATEMLKRALSHSPSGSVKAEALHRLGMIHMDRLDEPSEAKSYFEASIAEAPSAHAIDALLIFVRDDEDDEAIARLLEQKAPIAEGRDRLSTYTELAALYQRLGRLNDQLLTLERAYQEAPEASKIVEQLISRYLKDGRLSEAEPMIHKMIEQQESAGKTKALNRYTFQLGQLKQAQGDQASAFELFERCRAVDPTFAPALIALSELYVQATRWDDAQELLSSLLLQRKLSSEERVQVFYLNGVTRSALGDERKARDMFQRALGLNPEHEPSQRGMNQLNS